MITNESKKEIHNGDMTHHHDQVMPPVSFSTTKIRVRMPLKLIPCLPTSTLVFAIPFLLQASCQVDLLLYIGARVLT
jgi:hypothetical protein